ncbi:uncharacterized protein yc1106_06850 [Curvularia clavata]|uniref:Rhodopsin domain-containing protein n=1 Tax=Curvularia clavata TaxID=95742 RepID=A0A9Q8ZCB0_CURCL|nr:uncharacterized protein yc1106_06850 [Curvularia clavata]
MDAVKIISWTIAVVVAVVLIVRQSIKAMILRKAGLDDGFILLASVFAISLSVTTLALAADHPDSSASFNSEQEEVISKGYYASELFYISAICFPKLSILILFYNIVGELIYREHGWIRTCAKSLTLHFLCTVNDSTINHRASTLIGRKAKRTGLEHLHTTSRYYKKQQRASESAVTKFQQMVTMERIASSSASTFLRAFKKGTDSTPENTMYQSSKSEFMLL